MPSGQDAGAIGDELGAHISAAGGVERAPRRAREIESVNLQLFTKQPNRWFEPEISPEDATSFRAARREEGILAAAAHDSYLINLASPREDLWQKSLNSFRLELMRCESLGLDYLVTHPGNATDGDLASGIARNAEGIGRALDGVPGQTRVLLEITAGSGTSIGGTFEALYGILQAIPAPHRNRVGICFDTCHAYSAGYDLVNDYEGVWNLFDEILDVDRLGLFHMNDSRHPLGSRKDRHAHIGEGTLGDEPFRRIMTDDRFANIPKVLETPKGEDMVTLDRMNLGRLRGFRQEG